MKNFIKSILRSSQGKMASLFGMERREVIRIKVKVRKRQQYKAKLSSS